MNTNATWNLAAVNPVAPDRWGEDHWSTFAYVETRCVD